MLQMEPESGPSTYQYTPLAPIRLLHVSRDSDSSIRGHLEVFSLDSAPPFSTLSYVWGPESFSHAIWLDGHLFPILDSLHPILSALCDSDEFRDDHWVWIDSICINQHDPQERASQVQLMKRIFAQSDRTIAWLGGEPHEIREGLDFMQELSERYHEIIEFSFSKGTREVPPQLWVPSKWRALGRILELPWWRRIWTLQEFVLAQSTSLYCGLTRISEGTFARALSAIWYCEPHSSLLHPSLWSRPWHRRRLRQWHHRGGYTENMSLVALMAYTSSYELSDPRDRIYGLLGLAKESDRAIIGRPTYLDQVEDIYVRHVDSFIRTYQSLDIICFAQIFRPPDPEETDGLDVPAPPLPRAPLPSWVPDWRIRTEPFVTPLMVSQTAERHIGNFRPIAVLGWAGNMHTASYNADAGMECHASTDLHSGCLTCRGFVFDLVDGVGSMLSSPDHHTDQQASTPITQCTSPINLGPSTSTDQSPKDEEVLRAESISLLNDLVRCATLDREDRYLAIRAPGTRYQKEFLNLLELAAVVDPESLPARCRSALAWYRANKDLLWRGRTVEQICLDSMDEDNPVDLESTDATEDSFASRLIDCTSPLTMRYRLLVTQRGVLGMAPPGARKGDVVCVLAGCSVPVVLRRAGDSGHSASFTFIGECYIHGIMNGELVCQGLEEQDFVLI